MAANELRLTITNAREKEKHKPGYKYLIINVVSSQLPVTTAYLHTKKKSI